MYPVVNDLSLQKGCKEEEKVDKMQPDGGKGVEHGGEEGDKGDFGGKMGGEGIGRWAGGPAEFRGAVGDYIFYISGLNLS